MTSLRAALRRRRGAEPADGGFAMVLVLGIGTVMTALMLVALTASIQALPQARHEQDWNAALAAAQAGVDDYVQRLNASDSYALSVDCSNPALKGPNAGTNACGWTATTAPGWQMVKQGDATQGWFHYDTSYTLGGVMVTATGKMAATSQGGKSGRFSYRTIQSRVARSGSTDFLYYTDYEDADPSNVLMYPGGAPNDCGGSGVSNAKYWYEKATGFGGTPSPTSTTGHRAGCVEIGFGPNDVLDGPVHFNDSPGIAGATSGGLTKQATFKQGYETSDPNCTPAKAATTGYCWRVSPYGAGNSTASGKPYFPSTAVGRYADPLQLPDNSAEFANDPGCVYYGDTRIRFNNDGTMTVWNTSSAGKTIVNPASPAGTSCGVAASFGGGSSVDAYNRPTSGQTVPVPNDMVVYVRNSGSSNVCIPGEIVNGTASGSTANDVIPQGSGYDRYHVTDVNFSNLEDGSSAKDQSVQTWTSNGSSWTSSSKVTNPAGFPNTPAGDSHASTADCGQGNVYVEGTVKGRVTIAAENNLVVTGNLLLSSTPAGALPQGTDMVGLVASNSVQVYHPVTRAYTNDSGSPSQTSYKGATKLADTVCSSTIGGTPAQSASAFGSGTLSCTWNESRSYKSENTIPYTDLAYPASTGATGTRYVYGSVQTLQHSFGVQWYRDGGGEGTLAVRGSIAQRFRGTVLGSYSTGGGSGNGGYNKDYSYDTRLKLSSPPYFPEWKNSKWGAKASKELKAAYVGK